MLCTLLTLFNSCVQQGSGDLYIPGYSVGYNGTITLLRPMVEALDFIDAALMSFFDSLKTAGIDTKTLVIVSAKHGQCE
jgi:predicted AlkP superfamily pyrophosphatase or phosphodiesterase